MHTHTRQYYLSDIPLSEALQTFHDALAEAGALTLAEAETLALDQAHGRVTAAPVWAVRSSPHYDAAAMDGVAVRAGETIGLQRRRPCASQWTSRPCGSIQETPCHQDSTRSS
jgi:putative molybdopterin biosynthesis protein